MASIKQLQQNGNDIYPVTSTKAIYGPDGTNIDDYISGKLKSTTKSYTLSASSWSNGQYTISDSLITASSYQEITTGIGITADQYKAFSAGMIVDGGQSAGNLILKCLGTVPTIDIPIRVIYRGTI